MTVIRHVLFCLGFFASSAIACAQPVDPLNQPDDFSEIIGKFDIKASATPTDVEVLEPITLRVEITGVGEKTPRRQDLKLFPAAWKNDFWVQPLPELDEVIPGKNTWVFVYRLKAKSVKVKEIYDIKLVYYDRNSPEKTKYVTRYANDIALTVRPKTDVMIDIQSMPLLPSSFYEQSSRAQVLATASPLTISRTQLVIFLTLPPLLCIICAVFWRRIFPDAAQLARRQRDNSRVRALAALQAGGSTAEKTVRRYLQDRFDFPIEDATPGDVAAFLKRRGFAKAVCGQALAFFQECDAARFSLSHFVEPNRLGEEAVSLIQALEADRCARC